MFKREDNESYSPGSGGEESLSLEQKVFVCETPEKEYSDSSEYPFAQREGESQFPIKVDEESKSNKQETSNRKGTRVSFNTSVKRKRPTTEPEYESTSDGLLICKSVQPGEFVEPCLKKNNVIALNASEVEGFWLTIQFCIEKDFVYCLSLCTVLLAKEMLSYFSRICQRKIPFVVCSSGWGHAKNLDFISTNLDSLQSIQKAGSICVHISTPSQSRLVVISLPTCVVDIKDYIPTLNGKHSTKPTYELIKKEELRISGL